MTGRWAMPVGVPSRRAALHSLAALSLSACTGLPLMTPPLTRHIESRLHLAQPGQRAPTLLILLPGAYDGPADFERQGFVDAVRARGLAADVQLVDAHAGYYTAQRIVEQLHTDVLQPARAAGHAQVWLCGISLGGYGALLTAREHGPLIDGMFTMAAFLGRRDLPAAIAQAGGLAAWPGELEGADVHDLALWRWLRGYATPPEAARRPRLFMGWGEDDRFVMSNRLVAATLPPSQVLTTSGGHQWAPWKRLWARFLDRAPWADPRTTPRD
ncbi:alpha/beta hydrolase [Ottowia testudinis]|uniref:Alpha/beta hydrolase n=1 Tax=Ottowia testudinis TaxID=2816950 RepID=A0A975CE47_9BURK|nr:alpha/beta hydrolase [Ottowia testudinis]QTD44172.1 alpha/beta hydrolase [Ottowia testudinis]